MTLLIFIATAFLPGVRATESKINAEITALHELALSTYLADQIGFHPKQVAEELSTGIAEVKRRLSMLDNFMPDADPRRRELRNLNARLSAIAQMQVETSARGRTDAKIHFDALRDALIYFADLGAPNWGWRQTPHGRVFEAIGAELADLVVALTEINRPATTEVTRVIQRIEDFSRFLDDGPARRSLGVVRGALESAAEVIAANPSPVRSGVHRHVAQAVREYLTIRRRLGAAPDGCAWALRATPSAGTSSP